MSEVKLSKEQQAYIDELLAQQAQQFEKKMDSRLKQERINECKLAATVQETRQVQGKPIIDDETKEQKVDTNGVPQSYPDKYYASLTFDGGSIEVEIQKDQFDVLVPSKRYLCDGHIGDVRVFVNKSIATVKALKVTSFTQL